jgi:cell division protein FtsB
LSTNPFPQRPEAAPRRKFPIGRWIVVVFLLFTVYAWTFGPYGIVRQRRTAAELESIRKRNDSLRINLNVLQDSLRLLRSDSATIASEARSQGLVLPGEVSVRFVDTSASR